MTRVRCQRCTDTAHTEHSGPEQTLTIEHARIANDLCGIIDGQGSRHPNLALAATDHVTQIAEEALNALPGFDLALLRRFGDDNPDALTLLRQRVASSWAGYDRQAHPRLADHPGHRLVRELERRRSYPRW